MHGLNDNIEVRVVGAAVAAGSSIDNNSSRIDMADYESVTFICTITDSVATGVAAMAIQQSDADSDTAMAEIDGTEATATSSTNDDLNGLALQTEVYHPTKRYVQATRVSSVANIAYGEVIALLVPRQKPVTAHATIADSARVAY